MLFMEGNSQGLKKTFLWNKFIYYCKFKAQANKTKLQIFDTDSATLCASQLVN